MKVLAMPRLKCCKCGHIWTPRKAFVMICPKCKRKNTIEFVISK